MFSLHIISSQEDFSSKTISTRELTHTNRDQGLKHIAEGLYLQPARWSLAQMVTARTPDITDDTMSLNKFHYAQVCTEPQLFQITKWLFCHMHFDT